MVFVLGLMWVAFGSGESRHKVAFGVIRDSNEYINSG